jgi:hypothetical protein
MLKHRQGKDKVYHTKRLHRKANKLHAKAIKHEHPSLINKIGNYVGAMGTALKKGYQGYRKDYDAKQLQKSIEKDKNKPKTEEELKEEAYQKILQRVRDSPTHSITLKAGEKIE